MRCASNSSQVPLQAIVSPLGSDSERIRLLADLNAHIVNSVEAERKALARDLHDEMGATLALMSLALSTLEDPSTDATLCPNSRRAVSRMRELLGCLNQYKHRVVEGLRPPLLEDFTFDDVLRRHLERFSEHTGLKVSLRVSTPSPALNEIAKLTLFRAVQEILTNAARHASAHQIDVRLRHANRRVEVVIVDDGIGCPAGVMTNSNGFGLLGVRERLQAVGGYLDIARASGCGGTRVLVSVPASGNTPNCPMPKEYVGN